MKYVSIDSSDRIDPSNTPAGRCVIPVPDIETSTPYNRIVLLGAIIPKSWYLIQDENSTFTLTEGVTSYTVTLETGNYSLTSLATALQNALNTVGSWTYTVTPVISRGHLLFAVSGNTSQPVLTFGSVLARIFGFEGSLSATFSANQLESSTVCSLQKTQSIIIKTSLVSEDGILGQLFSGIQDLGILSYVCPSPIEYSRKLLSVQRTIDILLLDAIEQTEVNLNGGNFQFQLGYYVDVIFPTLISILEQLEKQKMIAKIDSLRRNI